MTASLSLYRIGTRLLEPAAPWLIERRLKSGKERPERAGERFGTTTIARPDGVLIWMHGASVGECRLLLDVFGELRKKRPHLQALITSQTLTSADMIAAAAKPGVIHQMAPVDAPGAVDKFFEHWRPNAAVFAEGEIWPNMIGGLKTRGIPAALINARMTRKTLQNWCSRPAAAEEVFSAFGFIGTADEMTADGLETATQRKIETIGNLKIATEIEKPSMASVASFRMATRNRPIVLAASTHHGEDEFALEAFVEARRTRPDLMMIDVPRHPERASDILNLFRLRGLTTQQWSKTKTLPGLDVDVVVADTIGELLFWYAVSDSVFLGGATSENVGGHNPVEPAHLGRRVFTGPHGYNFKETFEALEKVGALKIGTTHQELVDWWLSDLSGKASGPALASFFASARAPLDTSLAAILAMLDKPAR